MDVHYAITKYIKNFSTQGSGNNFFTEFQITFPNEALTTLPIARHWAEMEIEKICNGSRCYDLIEEMKESIDDFLNHADLDFHVYWENFIPYPCYTGALREAKTQILDQIIDAPQANQDLLREWASNVEHIQTRVWFVDKSLVERHVDEHLRSPA